MTLSFRVGLTFLPTMLILAILQFSRTTEVAPDLEYLNEIFFSVKLILELILLTVMPIVDVEAL